LLRDRFVPRGIRTVFSARPRNGVHWVRHPESSVYTGCVDESQPNSNSKPVGPALRFVVAALILRDGQILIAQLRPDQPMALQWEFPGGKIEPGETAEQALIRELHEELGIEAVIDRAVTTIRHSYRNGGVIEIEFFTASFAGELSNRIFHQMLWSPLSRLPDYDFLAADLTLIRDLAQGKLL
jgi:8-oxo-dGTP diphosphatase